MILRDRNRVPFHSIWIHPIFWCVWLVHLLSFLCRGLLCVVCLRFVSCVSNVTIFSVLSTSCVLFVYVLCLVCLRLVSCLSTSCVLFVYVLCLVCQMLPFSLYCPFLIAPSAFSNVYLFRTFEALIYSLTTTEWKQRREHASQIVSVEWFHQRTVSPSVINLAFLVGDRFMRLSHSLSASANVLPDRSVRVLLCVGNFMM